MMKLEQKQNGEVISKHLEDIMEIQILHPLRLRQKEQNIETIMLT